MQTFLTLAERQYIVQHELESMRAMKEQRIPGIPGDKGILKSRQNIRELQHVCVNEERDRERMNRNTGKIDTEVHLVHYPVYPVRVCARVCVPVGIFVSQSVSVNCITVHFQMHRRLKPKESVYTKPSCCLSF